MRRVCTNGLQIQRGCKVLEKEINPMRKRWGKAEDKLRQTHNAGDWLKTTFQQKTSNVWSYTCHFYVPGTWNRSHQWWRVQWHSSETRGFSGGHCNVAQGRCRKYKQESISRFLNKLFWVQFLIPWLYHLCHKKCLLERKPVAYQHGWTN